jgi:hypothetical protein
MRSGARKKSRIINSALPEMRRVHFKGAQRSFQNARHAAARLPALCNARFTPRPRIRMPRLQGHFSLTMFPRSVGVCEHLEVVSVADFLAGIDVNPNCCHRITAEGPRWPTRCRRNSRCYLILAKHSFRRSSSERTCVSMASCNASAPLLDNSAEAFLSRFCFQSRIACLVVLWASDVALRYAFMQVSAIEQVLHS